MAKKHEMESEFLIGRSNPKTRVPQHNPGTRGKDECRGRRRFVKLGPSRLKKGEKSTGGEKMGRGKVERKIGLKEKKQRGKKKRRRCYKVIRMRVRHSNVKRG